jgi:hypothetical protein
MTSHGTWNVLTATKAVVMGVKSKRITRRKRLFKKGVKVKEKKKHRIKVSSAKAKGRACQQYVMGKISELLGIPCGKDELIASREMGQSGTDVRLIGEAKKRFPWAVECKWQETWSVPAWIEQAKENQSEGTNWLLVARRNRSEFVAILDADIFFDLLKELEEVKK